MKTLKRYRIFFALICIILLLGPAIGSSKAGPAQQAETDFAAIDEYVTTQMNDLGIPGMALGVVQDGQIVHLQGFGTADSSGRAVTPQTPFHIGSVTKSFTALAVMQLVEAGKIDLDAAVQEYLPWFELADKEASAEITVRNLLNHSTGISTRDGNRDFPSPQGLEEKVRGLRNLELTQPVGQAYQYSNINYGIAGLIVEKVSQQSYADYVDQHIFQPLDMRHSFASEDSALADGLTAGHLFMFGHAFEMDRPSPPAHLPSGWLIASVEDLSTYAIAHLNEGRFGAGRILSPEGIAELHAPSIPVNVDDIHYGMGWVVGSWDGIPKVSRHSGSDGRYHSVVVLMPDRGSGFVLLANATGFVEGWQVDEIAKGVFRLLNGKLAEPVTLPLGPRFIYWAVLLTPFLMILGIVYSWRHWLNKGSGHILLVVLLYSGVALLWLLLLPRLIEAPIWSGIQVNISQPELAGSLLASAILGFGWSVIYTVMNLRARRSKQDPAAA